MELPSPSFPLFLSLFILVYLAAYFLLFRRCPPAARSEASSCAISLLHGTTAALLAAAALLSDPSPSPSLASPNTPFQSLVLDFSTAYFATDILHFAVFSPAADVLFILHHVATLFVFLTCRLASLHGARAVLCLLFLAEVTSFCQNTWTLARLRHSESMLARKVLDVLSRPFYAFYSVVRGILGPLFVVRMIVFYAGGEARGLIPTWMWISWILVIATAITVSVLWIANLWAELYRVERKAAESQLKTD